MNLEPLKYFLHVAELRSVTKTAAAIGVTQPIISRSIAQLERELGGRLFHRTGHGVHLTPLGKAYLTVQGQSRETEALFDDASSFSNTPAGEVRIGMLPSFSAAVVSALEQVKTHLPKVKVKIFVGATARLDEWLEEARIVATLVAPAISVRASERKSRKLFLVFGAIMLICSPLIATCAGISTLVPSIRYRRSNLLKENNFSNSGEASLDGREQRWGETWVAVRVSIGHLEKRTSKDGTVQHGEDTFAVLRLVPELRKAREAQFRLASPGYGRQRTNAEHTEKSTRALRVLNRTDFATRL